MEIEEFDVEVIAMNRESKERQRLEVSVSITGRFYFMHNEDGDMEGVDSDVDMTSFVDSVNTEITGELGTGWTLHTCDFIDVENRAYQAFEKAAIPF